MGASLRPKSSLFGGGLWHWRKGFAMSSEKPTPQPTMYYLMGCGFCERVWPFPQPTSCIHWRFF
jgi:hypothetical protein